MPNSLKTKIRKLHYQQKITDEEYKELITKLNTHDKELFLSGYSQGFRDALDTVNLTVDTSEEE